MENKDKKVHKFRGGIWIGWFWANSWPSGTLEISKDFLVIRDEMIGKEFKFNKNQVVDLKIKTFLPFLGSILRIYHTREDYNKRLVFGCWNSCFKKLKNTLKEFEWV